jgi:hypothetical protein
LALGSSARFNYFQSIRYGDGTGVVYAFEAPIEIRDDTPAFVGIVH